jgi:hypothetical protein
LWWRRFDREEYVEVLVIEDSIAITIEIPEELVHVVVVVEIEERTTCGWGQRRRFRFILWQFVCSESICAMAVSKRSSKDMLVSLQPKREDFKPSPSS